MLTKKEEIKWTNAMALWTQLRDIKGEKNCEMSKRDEIKMAKREGYFLKLRRIWQNSMLALKFKLLNERVLPNLSSFLVFHRTKFHLNKYAQATRDLINSNKSPTLSWNLSTLKNSNYTVVAASYIQLIQRIKIMVYSNLESPVTV